MTGPILLGILAIITFGAVLSSWVDGRQKNARADRKKLRAHEEWMDDIHNLAIQNKDLDPFAAIVAGRVREFHNNQKGLNP